MRTTAFQLLSLLAAITVDLGSLTAQTADPKGLIIYKSSGLASNENAMAAEYSEIQFNPVIVNGRKVDGSMFRIVASEFIDSIEYPDLKRGVFTTPDQIESFKSAGRKMMTLSEKFPTAKAILAARIEEMKLAAVKFDQGQFLIAGTWNANASPPSSDSRDSIAKEPVIGGREFLYQGRKISGHIKGVYPDAVVLMTQNGVLRIPLASQSEEIKTEFKYDELSAYQYSEQQRANEEAHRAARTAEKDEQKRRASARQFYLKVIQVFPDNSTFLVSQSSEDDHSIFLLRITDDLKNSLLLKGKLGNIVDGDRIRGSAYFSDEVYRYKAVSGAENTVRILNLFKLSD